MNVLPISAFSDNYIWAIIDNKSRSFYCVDPGEAAPVLQFAKENQLELRSILLTHHHYDHIGGVAQLLKHYPGSLVYGPNDSRIPDCTNVVHEHDTIKIGSLKFRILFNPGHTSTHISYYEPDQEWLFCGDTLFSGGCGRVFDGTMEELHQSLLMFKNLPRNTKIFCAHEYTQQNLRFAHTVEPKNQSILNYSQQLAHQVSSCSLPSTLDIELSINPFLRTDIKEVIDYARKHGAPASDSLEVFKALRNQKNMFS